MVLLIPSASEAETRKDEAHTIPGLLVEFDHSRTLILLILSEAPPLETLKQNQVFGWIFLVTEG